MALLQRLYHIFAKPPADPGVTALYQACIIQARRPEFYGAYGVPDTVDGRFDLLLLHVYLVMRRLGGEVGAKQQLFDLMFADMDRNLREMGVGDMSIGKKMKPMLAAFYGRAQAYEKALMENDASLAETLARNLYGGKAVPADFLGQIADYVRNSVTQLDAELIENLLSGRAEFANLPVNGRAS